MTEPQQNPGLGQHLRKSKRLALALSLSIASCVLFLIYQYRPDLYNRLSFWELRLPAAILVFLVVFGVLWWRARRGLAKKVQD